MERRTLESETYDGDYIVDRALATIDACVKMLRRVEPVVKGDVPPWPRLRADLAALLAEIDT